MRKVVMQSQPKKNILFAILLLILIAAGFIYYNSRNDRSSLSSETTVITQSVLAEKYGLRVNLVAVTANGGMVDLRLKIIDAEKAKLLLQDKKNFPVLYVSNGNVKLNMAEETISQGIKFEDDGNVFLLYSNAGNSVRSGAPVTILFGDTALEPLNAK